MPMAQCFRDHKKVEVKNPKYELNKRGRPMIKGTCPICGGKVSGLIAAKDAPAELRAKMQKTGGESGRRRHRSTTGSRSRSRSRSKTGGESGRRHRSRRAPKRSRR